MTTASLVIAPSLILILTIIGGLWKFASSAAISSKMEFTNRSGESWPHRESSGGITQLHRQIGELMGAGGQFDPTKVVAEPRQLLSSVLYFKKLIDAREGTSKWYLSYLIWTRS